MYPSALSTKINSDVEFSRHLVESRSDKLRQVKSSPIHADFCSEAAIGGKKNNSTQKEELNNSTVERKQFNSTATCSACTLKTKTKTIAEGKQLNSTSTCAACSACKTTQLDLRLLRLPPPAQPFAAESAFLTYSWHSARAFHALACHIYLDLHYYVE
ncbi:hypothetical protein NPIL_283401 [Nephila pilipes]|uniref:Uncharacterized protein n=1 Tax=Nephila pilipes TaxID=299642 RepID=A0A8X6IH17_NEPPI|nr:hypothetical protein NPIL_283401 [Nephila pilipes]